MKHRKIVAQTNENEITRIVKSLKNKIICGTDGLNNGFVKKNYFMSKAFYKYII